MVFEWDESKRRMMLAQHRIDFEDAIRIFNGPGSGNTVATYRGNAVGRGRYRRRQGNRRSSHDPERPSQDYHREKGRTSERRDHHAYVVGESKGKTDWEWLRQQDAAGVDPDEGEFDRSQARVVMPPLKQAILVRIDRDVLDFFKSQGRGYQTRINAVLRSYMEAKRGQTAEPRG